MRRSLIIGFSFLAILPNLVATDHWKSKPVQVWTLEETLQFFRDSPWVRQVTVGAWSSPGAGSIFSTSPFGGSSQGCVSCAHIEPQQEQPRSGSMGGPSSASATTYYIQWTSARVVRQGFAHLLAMRSQGAEDPEAAPLDVFVVTVGGADLQAFEGIEEAQLQKEAWIRPRKSKAKIAASRVSVLRGDKERISVIHFGFPCQQDGQFIIQEAEKAVEFHCRCRDKTLRAEFDLRTMVIQGKRDL